MNKKTPSLAVDCIVLVPGGVVFIERRGEPLGLAIPGGFVDVGETLLTAVQREMQEELNLDVEILGQLGIYDNPERDPRQHVVSVVFVGSSTKMPVAGDDAKEIKLVRIEPGTNIKNLNLSLVFDHEQIVADFIKSEFMYRYFRAQETEEEKALRRQEEKKKYQRRLDNNEICSHRVGCSCVFCHRV